MVDVQNRTTPGPGRTTWATDGPRQLASAQDIPSLLPPRSKGDKAW